MMKQIINLSLQGILKVFWIFVSSVILVTSSGCSGEKGEDSVSERSLENGNGLNPEISFTSVENDLGLVREGERVIAWYDYQNTGDKPLIIQDIEAGCGCTVPRWSKEPLEAGDKGSIRVVFDSSGKRGMQHIRISVISNARNKKEDLFLKAIVESIN
jgi:hypothetical protein